MSHGRSLHRAIVRHRARLRTQREQAQNRLARQRWGSCARKVRYLTRADAERHRDSATAGCEAYPCRWCAGWHLSSKAGAA